VKGKQSVSKSSGHLDGKVLIGPLDDLVEACDRELRAEHVASIKHGAKL